MRTRLRELKAPTYGTKAQIWTRLMEHEKLEKERVARETYMTARRQELIEACDPVQPVQVPGAEPPSPLEVQQHNLTHIPRRRWCELCNMAEPMMTRTPGEPLQSASGSLR